MSPRIPALHIDFYKPQASLGLYRGSQTYNVLLNSQVFNCSMVQKEHALSGNCTSNPESWPFPGLAISGLIASPC